METMNDVCGIFTTLKAHKSDWKPVSSRKFSDAEKACIERCFIYIGKYKPAVCFLAKNGDKFYIDLDNCHIGDFDGDEDVDINTMNIVKLEYVGKSPESLKSTTSTRIKFDSPTAALKDIDFDDPFGLNK